MLAACQWSQARLQLKMLLCCSDFSGKNRSGDLLTVPGKHLMTWRVWIPQKATGVLEAFDNVMNVILSRRDYKPAGLDKASVPSSSTHGWTCQGSALVPRQTVGVCKEMHMLHLERSRTQAQQLLGCCPSAAADWWSIGHQTHRLGTRKEIVAMEVSSMCVQARPVSPGQAHGYCSLGCVTPFKGKVQSSLLVC